MANLARKPCRQPGCAALLVSSGYCEKHLRAKTKQSDAIRGSSNDRGYGYKWQQASKEFLKQNPFCVCDDCKYDPDNALASNVVDHKIDHKLFEAKLTGNKEQINKAQKIFWSRSNWQPMNKACHDKKTRQTNGSFKQSGSLAALAAQKGAGQKSPDIFF